MKVSELIEKLHDLHGDTEVVISNMACGGDSKLERVDFAEEVDTLVLVHTDENYIHQIEAKYRTFALAGVTRDGEFIDGKASGKVETRSLNAITKAVQKADKLDYFGTIERENQN